MNKMSTRKSNWIVIGISGVTNGGKTTLADNLQRIYPDSVLLNQDAYYFPHKDPRHVKVPGLNRNNYDILSSLDMDQMLKDVKRIISQQCKGIRLLILEGFTVLNFKPIMDLCDLKYQLNLSKEECVKRRALRTYDTPDGPGYFELCVWPEYLKYNEELKQFPHIIFLDGTRSDLCEAVTNDIDKLRRAFK